MCTDPSMLLNVWGNVLAISLRLPARDVRSSHHLLWSKADLGSRWPSRHGGPPRRGYPAPRRGYPTPRRGYPNPQGGDLQVGPDASSSGALEPVADLCIPKFSSIIGRCREDVLGRAVSR